MVRVVEAHVALNGHEVRDVNLQVRDEEPKDIARLRLGLREENRDARAVHIDALIHRSARRVDAEARRRAHAHAARADLELPGDDARDAGARAVLLDHQRTLPVLNHAGFARESADFQIRHRDADDALVARLTRELLEEEVALQHDTVRDRHRDVVSRDAQERSGWQHHADSFAAHVEGLIHRHWQIVNLNGEVEAQRHGEVLNLERVRRDAELQAGRDALRRDEQ